ncbi:hypothetical protein HHK36_008705 [Tetracentron sinense]|uniref:GDSL esterase/lipase EXL3 n=1 Tax=Tetracentron sinense TaxID=13715 RepID=A0A834ZJH9_TETSI|nr:hypothetical protein HHK36_008705 [Tetracentron sinense]
MPAFYPHFYILPSHHIQAALKLPNNETVPAVIVFGDSIVDPGNNNNLQTLIKVPSRRTEGATSSELSKEDFVLYFAASELGIKEILPAYLDPDLQIQDLITGVSFASGGLGYDPLTPRVVSVLSLPDQLNLFKEYIGKMKRVVGEEKTTAILSKSLFIVCAGSYDIANTYYSTPFRRMEYDVPAYTDLMEIYGHGARRVGIFSAPPIGCVPSQRTRGGGTQIKCVEERNEAAKLFNSKLSSELNSLNNKLPHARLVFFDIYNPVIRIIQSPHAYGFEVVNKGCCGTGNLEVAILCNELNPYTCTDVSKYLPSHREILRDPRP